MSFNTKDADRYSRIVKWALLRYSVKDEARGTRIYPRRFGYCPSRYSVIEDAAAAKFLRCKRHYPGWTLALAASSILPAEEQTRRRQIAADRA